MPKNQLELEIAPAGSCLYYSLLNTPEPQKLGMIALHGFFNEIMKTAERYKEAGVAQAKLLWWENEVQNIYHKSATHPIAKTLANYRNVIPEAALLAIIAAAKLAMEIQIYPTQAELSHHYQHTGGLLELLKARLLSNGSLDQTTEHCAQTLGIALETIRHIYDFAFHIQRGHLYLPADQMSIHNISIEEIITGKKLTCLLPIFRAQAEFARTEYHKALSNLRKSQHAELRPARVYAKLQMKLLDTIENNQFNVFSQQTQLSPLKKLWWSWRET